MRHLSGLVVLVAVSLALPRISHAQSFEEIAGDALRVDKGQLGGILWALTASCSDGDDLAKRQCRAVRDTVVATYQGQTLIVPGDASAFQVGEFDAKKKNAPIVLQGCVACVDPLSVDSSNLYVTSDKGATGWTGNVAQAGAIHKTSRTFKSADEATDWTAKVVPRLKTEFIVEVPKNLKVWKDGGHEGVSLTVLGFRVYDPCDGGIICSSPKSGKANVDKVACGGAVVEGPADEDVTPKDTTPDELSADMIKAAMQPVRDAASACHDKYGVDGDGKLHITVSSDGSVTSVDEDGDFKDTPTGTCIEKAAKAATFPAFKKAKQSFKYPIVLR
jgi:hypothetical protein